MASLAGAWPLTASRASESKKLTMAYLWGKTSAPGPNMGPEDAQCGRILLGKLSGQPRRCLATYREPRFWRQKANNGPPVGQNLRTWAQHGAKGTQCRYILPEKISGQPRRRLATYREPSLWEQKANNGPPVG